MAKKLGAFDGIRKVLAYDEAIAKLQEAGLAESFIAAIDKDPELQKSLEKLVPGLSSAASPGWSCCITVSNPVGIRAGEVIKPPSAAESSK